jgi:hypothetical protein
MASRVDKTCHDYGAARRFGWVTACTDRLNGASQQ